MAAAAEMRAAREVDELPAGAADTSTSPAFGLRSAASARARPSGTSSSSATSSSPSRRTTTRPSSVKRTMPADGSRVETLRNPARIVRVDHGGAVRRGDEVVARVEARRLLDVRLPVVGADDHCVALEELVAARRPRPSAPATAASLRASASCADVGPGGVRGEVVVRQVVDEEVEAVARHQPASDRTRRRRRSSRARGCALRSARRCGRSRRASRRRSASGRSRRERRGSSAGGGAGRGSR